MGTLHGGVLCDISDAAMGSAWASALVDGETCTTIELKINFFRPVWSGRLIAEASRPTRQEPRLMLSATFVTSKAGWSLAQAVPV